MEIGAEEFLVVQDGQAILTTAEDTMLCCLGDLDGGAGPPFRVTNFPWLPLTAADAEVLHATARSIAAPEGDAEAKLAALHFTSSVLLKDFPPEVLLQRPSLLMSLVECMDETTWQLQLAAMQCLQTLTQRLLQRVTTSLLPHSSTALLETGNGKCWMPPDQPLEAQGNTTGIPMGINIPRGEMCDSELRVLHPHFQLPADPLDTEESEALKSSALTVPQFAVLVLQCPLTSPLLLGGDRPALMTAAAGLLDSLLQLLRACVCVPALWRCFLSCDAPALPSAGRGGDVHAGDHQVQAVRDLVAAVKCSLEGVAQCVSSSHVLRCGSRSRAVVLQHCSAFVQSRAVLLDWLHTFAQPALCAQHLVTEATSEAVVLVMADISSLLTLLPPSPPLLSSPLSSTSASSSSVSSVSSSPSLHTCRNSPLLPAAAALTGDSVHRHSPALRASLSRKNTMPAECGEPPESLVTLFAALLQIDELSHAQVSSMVRVSCSLQSCVAFMRCSSQRLPAFLDLALASVPALLLHSSQLCAKKLVEGICKQYHSVSAAHQAVMRGVLLYLLSQHKLPQVMDAVLSSLHAVMVSCVGAAAAAQGRQVQPARCCPLLHPQMLRALLVAAAAPTSQRQIQWAETARSVLLVLLCSQHTMGEALWSRLCSNVAVVWPLASVLAGQLGAPLLNMRRAFCVSCSTDQQLLNRQQLAFLCDVQNLFHTEEQTRRTAHQRVVERLLEAAPRLRCPTLQSPRGRDLFIVPPTQFVPDYHHIQIQPQQVMRISELLDLHAQPSSSLDHSSRRTDAACSEQDRNMRSALWRQLSYLTQHPDHCTVLLGVVPLYSFTSALEHMLEADVWPAACRDAGCCLELLRHLASYKPSCRRLLAAQRDALALIARATLLLEEDQRARQHGAVLLFLLLMEPHILQPPLPSTLPLSSPSSVTHDNHSISPQTSDNDTPASADRTRSRSLMIVPSIPEILSRTLIVPFVHTVIRAEECGRVFEHSRVFVESVLCLHDEQDLCSADGVSREDGSHDSPHGVSGQMNLTDNLRARREQNHNFMNSGSSCRTRNEEPLEDNEMLTNVELSSEEHTASDGTNTKSFQELSLVPDVRAWLENVCSSAFVILDLLSEGGSEGCSELVQGFLKMVWAVCSAGGASKVRLDVDYSSNFSDFFFMTEKEKLLFESMLPELYFKGLLRDVDNGTNLKDVKQAVCLIENRLAVAVGPGQNISSSCGAAQSAGWWRVLGRFLRRVPATLAELQLYCRVVAVVRLLLKVTQRLPEKTSHEPALGAALSALLLVPSSPFCETLAAAGTREWGDASRDGNSSVTADQVWFGVFTSLVSLIRELTYMAGLCDVAGNRDPPAAEEAGPPGGGGPPAGERLGAVVTQTLAAVIQQSLHKSPYSLGVLCSSIECISSMAGKGWLRSLDAAAAAVSSAVSLLEWLSEGRGGSNEAFLGRCATLHATVALSHTLAHTSHFTELLPLLSCEDPHPSGARESVRPLLRWLPTALSYRDSAVRSACWSALAALVKQPSALTFLLRSEQGTVQLWDALFSCITSFDRPEGERAAACCFFAHLAAALPAADGGAAQDGAAAAAPLPPFVVDTETQASVSGAEGVLVLAEHHGLYRALLAAMARPLMVNSSSVSAVASCRDFVGLRLLRSVFLLLCNLTALRPQAVSCRVVEEGLLPFVITHVEEVCALLSSPAGTQHHSWSLLASCLECGAGLLLGVLGRQLPCLGAMSRDAGALPDALVLALSSGAWLGDACVTSVLELLALLVDSRCPAEVRPSRALSDGGPQASPHSPSEPLSNDHSPSNNWACLRVMAVLDSHHDSFFRTLIRSLHVTRSADSSATPTADVNCCPRDYPAGADTLEFTMLSERPPCARCAQVLTQSRVDSSRLALSKSAATFLALFVASLMERHDVPGDADLMQQLVPMLELPVNVHDAHQKLYPGYELARHLIHLISDTFTPSEFAPSTASAQPQTNPRGGQLTRGRSIKNSVDKNPAVDKQTSSDGKASGKTHKHALKAAARDRGHCKKCSTGDPGGGGVEPAYLECLGLLALVSPCCRYACHHLSALLWPPLLAPLEDLPLLLQRQAVHLTANLLAHRDTRALAQQVCRSLRLLTNIACAAHRSPDASRPEDLTRGGTSAGGEDQTLAEAVLPLIHQLWLPSLHSPELLRHLLLLLVALTSASCVSERLLHSSALQWTLLTAERSSRPLLACLAHTALSNLDALVSSAAPPPPRRRPPPPNARGRGSLPAHLVSPASLRGANTTLLGGAVAVPDSTTLLVLCVLTNCARFSECAAAVAKSGVLGPLLRLCSYGDQGPGSNEMLEAALKLLLVLSLHAGPRALILKEDWLRSLHCSLPSSLSPLVLRTLTSLTAAPGAVTAMLAHEGLLKELVDGLSQLCSSGSADAGACDGPCSAAHSLLVLVWALAASGHKAAVLLRRMGVDHLVRHLSHLLHGRSPLVRKLVHLLDE